MSIVRELRRSNETSTIPTPSNETEMVVYGQGIVGGLVVAPAQVVGLKEASFYFALLKRNIEGLGGVSFDVVIRRYSGQRSDCVIRHKAFGSVSEVSFPYTAMDLKNQWASFRLIYDGSEIMSDYFNWLKTYQNITGHESLDTPPSLVK